MGICSRNENVEKLGSLKTSIRLDNVNKTLKIDVLTKIEAIMNLIRKARSGIFKSLFARIGKNVKKIDFNFIKMLVSKDDLNKIKNCREIIQLYYTLLCCLLNNFNKIFITNEDINILLEYCINIKDVFTDIILSKTNKNLNSWINEFEDNQNYIVFDSKLENTIVKKKDIEGNICIYELDNYSVSNTGNIQISNKSTDYLNKIKKQNIVTDRSNNLLKYAIRLKLFSELTDEQQYKYKELILENSKNPFLGIISQTNENNIFFNRFNQKEYTIINHINMKNNPNVNKISPVQWGRLKFSKNKVLLKHKKTKEYSIVNKKNIKN